MVKRTLIAIALVALLAASVQAQVLGPEPHYGQRDGHSGYGIKVNDTYDAIWPFEYVALDLCVIPITMEVGYYIEIEKCNERKIKLIQVECGDMEKGHDWPCYKDCENIKIRSNFDAKIGLSLRNASSIIHKWAAYFDGDATGVVGPGTTTLKVCVEAWKARLYEADLAQGLGTWVKVGDLAITVKPAI